MGCGTEGDEDEAFYLILWGERGNSDTSAISIYMYRLYMLKWVRPLE